MLFVEAIFYPGAYVVLAFNGNGETGTFAIVIRQRGTAAGPQYQGVNVPGAGDDRIVTAGNEMNILSAVGNSGIGAKADNLRQIAIAGNIAPVTQRADAYPHSRTGNTTPVTGAAYAG